MDKYLLPLHLRRSAQDGHAFFLALRERNHSGEDLYANHCRYSLR